MSHSIKRSFFITGVAMFSTLIFLNLPSWGAEKTVDPTTHPDTTGWEDLFAPDLSNAIYPEGVWSLEDGVFTATEDETLWSKKDYDNFTVDLEFKTEESANSGVVVYCSDIKDWIPNAVEVQILDDHSEHSKKYADTWKCGAIFGHLAANEVRVKKPGEWNRFTITCIDKMIYVVLNGKLVTEMDMSLWTNGKTNPDGSEIPDWTPKPYAELPTHGRIGLQGRHAKVPTYFRNIKIKELD